MRYRGNYTGSVDMARHTLLFQELRSKMRINTRQYTSTPEREGDKNEANELGTYT